MSASKKPTLEEFAVSKKAAIFAENSEIARANRALRTTVADQKRELRELTQRLGLYERLQSERLAPPEWLVPKRVASEHTAIPCLLLTDVHWDEVVRPEQVDGVNAYNRTIAEQRLRRAFEGTVKVSRDYMAGLHYDGVQVFLGGDMLSGIIHEELRETNQAAIIESIMSLVEPLEAGLNLLAASFERVHVSAVVGNHGRTTLKPRAKRRAQESFDWLIYQMVARDFRAKGKVTLDISDAADAHVQVFNTRYLLTHGDQFRGGSGISGQLSPLLLGAHRKTRRQAAAGKPYDVMVLGHFHSSLFYPSKGLIVGGSLVGYSEFAYQANLEPEPPLCSLWLTTPEHGITFYAPVFVGDRHAEGW